MNSDPGLILVVDDNKMNRDMLANLLRRRDFTVVMAENGLQALDLIGSRDFDVVLLDVMMPGIDGMQVLETIRKTRPVADLPVIMATAKDQSADVVRALQLGANDYVTKPLDIDVVLARVMKEFSLKRTRQALEAAHGRMKTDLEAAARIQQALMPRSLPDVNGVRFAWRFEPCTELAGDILDVVRLDNTSIGLYLLDVSGHGVPAALLSVTLSRVLSHMADGASLLREGIPGSKDHSVVPPVEVANRLNRQFPMDFETRQYFTFLYGILNLENFDFRYVSAGHPLPVHVRQDADPEIQAGSGFAIGWFPDGEYEERSLRLSPGDRLYFYSDGTFEAKNSSSELFGTPRLTASLRATRSRSLGDSLDILLHDVREWCGDLAPDDDISLLAVQVDSSS